MHLLSLGRVKTLQYVRLPHHRWLSPDLASTTGARRLCQSHSFTFLNNLPHVLITTPTSCLYTFPGRLAPRASTSTIDNTSFSFVQHIPFQSNEPLNPSTTPINNNTASFIASITILCSQTVHSHEFRFNLIRYPRLLSQLLQLLLTTCTFFGVHKTSKKRPHFTTFSVLFFFSLPFLFALNIYS